MRTFNAALHNSIANAPGVAEAAGWKPDQGLVNLDHLVSDPNTFLMHGGDREITAEDIELGDNLPGVAMIFCWSAPGVFEAHTLAHPNRSKNSLQEAKALIHEMVTRNGADMVWGRPSSENIRACKFFEKIGATYMGNGDNPIVGPVTYYGGRKDAWLRDHWNGSGS